MGIVLICVGILMVILGFIEGVRSSSRVLRATSFLICQLGVMVLLFGLCLDAAGRAFLKHLVELLTR